MEYKHTLGSWISKANAFYETAKFLENPIIVVNYNNIDVTTPSWYLLHHSMELFLKSILINYNKFDLKTAKIHDLNKLSDKIIGLNQKIDKELNAVKSDKKIKQWLFFINPFGYPNGGLRYSQSNKGLYAAPLGISYFFSDLIVIIKEICDLKKEIDLNLLS